MDSTLDMAPLIASLGSDEPWLLGKALGTMLYYFSPLVSTHLESSIHHASKVPNALPWATGYIELLDECIAHLRLDDGLSEGLVQTNRKDKKQAHKYVGRYVCIIEATFKKQVKEVLADVFEDWDAEQTQLFNKGVGKALSGIQWCVYPKENVVLAAGDGDWKDWIRGECEKLAMVEARAGRRILEDV